jgi:hypothetical protein
MVYFLYINLYVTFAFGSQTVHECSLDGPLQIYVFCSGMKFQMAATAGLSLTLDPMGKMFQNASSLTIGSNVKLSPAVAAILNFISEQKM